jgi:hypothetical protein
MAMVAMIFTNFIVDQLLPHTRQQSVGRRVFRISSALDDSIR